MSNTLRKIMMVATIRQEIDSSFSEDDIHNGNYFDVMEKIIRPSEDGDYCDYDAVAILDGKQEKFVKSIFDGTDIRIAYLNI